MKVDMERNVEDIFYFDIFRSMFFFYTVNNSG